MGAVDDGDQMLASYPIERKRTKIWYKKYFCHLLNQTVLNCYVLCMKNQKNDDAPQMNHLEFFIKLTEQLLEKYHLPKPLVRRGRPSVDVKNDSILQPDISQCIIPANPVKSATTRRCTVCCNQPGPDGKKLCKETKYYCPDCDVGLCAAPCFGIYHTQYKY